MAEFNITNSKIEQLNDQGNNLKIANNSAPVVVSGGDTVQTAGDGNMVETIQNEKSIWGRLWQSLKSGWKAIFGR